MLKRFLIISSFFLILLTYSGNEAFGQLITDSDKRLKTQKSDKKGWLYNLFHQDKGKSSSKRALQQRKLGASPRYSSGSPFAAFNKRKSQTPRSATSQRRDLFKKQRYTSPRYSSSGLAGIMSGKKKPIRFSSTKPPFSKKDKRITPRYSSSKPFQQSLFARLFQQDSRPRSASGSPFSRKQMSATPRYSAGTPFSRKEKFVTPRYSAGSPFEKNFLEQLFNKQSGPRSASSQRFSKKDKSVTPRYSAGSPFEKSFLERLFNPESQIRYSAGSPFTRKQLSVTPRYSTGSPFTRKQKLVTPRYSQGGPEDQSFFDRLFAKKLQPRYSAGSPFTKKEKTVTPRYSQGRPYELNLFDKIFKSQPDIKYSAGSPFTRKQKTVTPRYSVGGPEDQAFLERLFNKRVQPRYSKGSPFASMRWSWIKPRYSTNKHKFDGNERQKEGNRIYNFEVSKYRGLDRGDSKIGFTLDNLWSSNRQKNYEGTKVPMYNPKQGPSANFSGNFKRKWISENEMHPSFRHNKVNSDSRIVRKGLRKWNVFWTRLNRNKVQPDAVTDKISKPKFDRKEADIWNN